MRLPVDHFKFIARWYDGLPARPADDPVFGLLAVEPGHRVLDIGGGTGRNMAPLTREAQVVVCDLSRHMLDRARGRGLQAILGSAVRLPFRSASADRILVVDAFHHFVDPSPQVAQPAAARELLRVLKPGGRVVVEEPDIRVRAVKAIALGEKLLLMGSRILPPDDIVSIFESSGARTVDRRLKDATSWLAFSK